MEFSDLRRTCERHAVGYIKQGYVICYSIAASTRGYKLACLRKQPILEKLHKRESEKVNVNKCHHGKGMQYDANYGYGRW